MWGYAVHRALGFAAEEPGHMMVCRKRPHRKATLVPAFLILGSVLASAGCSQRSTLPAYGAVPAFELTDQTGGPFSSAAILSGHVWVADFFFTTCAGPCPRMSSQMHQVQKALAEDGIRLVSFSVDPAHDTPPVLQSYSKLYGARTGIWYLLTGKRDSLQRLDRDVFHLGDVDGSLQHSTRFVLMDKHSRIRGYYLTSEPDAISRLIVDARSLLRDRS